MTSHSQDYLLTISKCSSFIGMIYFHQRDIIHRDLKSSNGALYLHIQLSLFAASVRNCLVGYKGT